MITLWLAILFFDAWPTVAEVRCDRLELNHCYEFRADPKPRAVERFSQWIAWDWCGKHGEMHVSDWVFDKPDRVHYLGLSKDWYRIVIGQTDGTLIVIAPICYETWTKHDPEVDD